MIGVKEKDKKAHRSISQTRRALRVNGGDKTRRGGGGEDWKNQGLEEEGKEEWKIKVERNKGRRDRRKRKTWKKYERGGGRK